MANTTGVLPSTKLTLFIGNIAVVVTIIQFLSGVPACKQYIRNNTTGEASALPFLFGVISAVLWLLYGIIIEDSKQIFVNTVGLVLMLSYVIVFFKYSLRKREVISQILLCAIFCSFMLIFISNEDDNQQRRATIGSVAVSVTLLTVAAPFVKLYHVIKVKNTECLPFHLILMTFFVSAIWMVYGYLRKDSYLIIPNLICTLLAMFQLCLFLIYPSVPTKLTLLKTIHA